jgi:ectoine hydroxylase-related dioxygenase (phytanoyl-CoA dioxygenase family)
MFEFPKKMRKVFKDEAQQASFETNGYIVVPYYSKSEIAELLNIYEQLHPVEEQGFYPSTFSKNKHYRQTADHEIRRIGKRSIEKYLTDHTVVCGSFIVKYPGPESVMKVHQDMTLVDESEFTGINIWCPLVDLTETNGVLYVLKGSHRLMPTYRGSTIPGIYDDVQEAIIDFMEPLYLKAGEAVIFDQSIIHYSPPNLSEDIRIVTNTYFTHHNARFQTAYYDQDSHRGQVELFNQDEAFMTDFEQFGQNIYDRPKIGQSQGLFDYGFPKLTLKDLEQAYGKPKNHPPAPSHKAPAIFQNPEHQALFERQGYITLPFLSEEQIAELDHYFDDTHPQLPESGFVSDSYSGDFELKKKASDKIVSVFQPSYERYFQNYTPFGGSYLYKIPSEDSELVLHQDWTIVDEERYVALNVWVPLCDIHADNGPLMVLPGSHYPSFPVLRAPTLPFFFTGNEEVVMKNLVPVHVKAGEAVVLNQSLVHYSPPNRSSHIRKAITAGVKTKGAPMVFHYYDQKKGAAEVEAFAQEDDFLIRFDNFFEDIFKRPKIGKSLGVKPYRVPKLEAASLQYTVKSMLFAAGYSNEAPEENTTTKAVTPTHQKDDDRTFWQTYTPANILKEMHYRLFKKR